MKPRGKQGQMDFGHADLRPRFFRSYGACPRLTLSHRLRGGLQSSAASRLRDWTKSGRRYCYVRELSFE